MDNFEELNQNLVKRQESMDYIISMSKDIAAEACLFEFLDTVKIFVNNCKDNATSFRRTEKIKVGPEDIGKRVFVKSLNKTGTIVSHTDECIHVLLANDFYPQSFSPYNCVFLKGKH